MSLQIIVGSALILMGFIKLIHFLDPQNHQRLNRLEGFKAKFGGRLGVVIYLLIYIALPVLLGGILIFSGKFLI